MKKMSKENMIEANGGKQRCYTYYKCNICGSCLGAVWAIKLHCKSNHGLSTCWRTVYYYYEF